MNLPKMLITLKLFNHLDEESSVQISSEATVLELKQKIAAEQNINNIDDIQLFLDDELEDNYSLKKYGLTHNSELSLVVFNPDEEEEDYGDDDYEDDEDYDDEDEDYDDEDEEDDDEDEEDDEEDEEDDEEDEKRK